MMNAGKRFLINPNYTIHIYFRACDFRCIDNNDVLNAVPVRLIKFMQFN